MNQAGQKSFSDLPEEVLLTILLKTPVDVVEKLSESVPRVQQVFSKFEGLFPPPTNFSSDVFLSFTEKLCNGEYCWEAVLIKSHILTVRNPNFQWIKRHLKGVNELWFGIEKTPYNFMLKGNNEHVEMLRSIKEHCNLERVNIRPSGFPIEPLVDLFATGGSIKVTTNMKTLRNENLDSLLPKINELGNLEDVTRAEAENILKHKNLSSILMIIEEPYPMRRYIKEWRRGERVIHNWAISCKTKTDIPLGEIEYYSVDRESYLLLEVDDSNDYIDLSIEYWDS